MTAGPSKRARMCMRELHISPETEIRLLLQLYRLIVEILVEQSIKQAAMSNEEKDLLFKALHSNYDLEKVLTFLSRHKDILSYVKARGYVDLYQMYLGTRDEAIERCICSLNQVSSLETEEAFTTFVEQFEDMIREIYV